MKRFRFLLLIVLPVLGFGQNRIKITDSMTKINVSLSVTPAIKLKPANLYNIKMERIPNLSIIVREPLWIINDQFVDWYRSNIQSEDVELVDILKSNKAILKYGNKAKYGAIVLKFKETVDPEKYKDIVYIDEYETIVFAPGYETFLASQKPKDFYSESYLKAKNILMVNEWNYRCNNPSIYNPKIYEASIDYSANTDYGLDVEYELYMFFRFMEKENKMSLIGDKIS